MAEHIRTTHAVRLGLRQIVGAREEDMHKLVDARGAGYDSVRDLWLRSGLSAAVLERLADADAFRSLGLDRRQALWAVRGLDRVGDQDDLPLFAASRPERDSEPDAKLPPMPLGAHVVEDYRRLSLSLKAHPVAFMRARLDARGIKRSDALASLKSGERVAVAGLVLVRQRPGTAKGVIFMTLEDEAGVANLIVWPKAFERLRAIVIGARFVAATGKLQNEAGVIHLIVERMEDLTPMLGQLSDEGRTLDTLAPADEARRPPSPPQKRQGNRFAQVQLFADSRLAPPPAEERELDARAAGGTEFSLRGPAPPDAGGATRPVADPIVAKASPGCGSAQSPAVRQIPRFATSARLHYPPAMNAADALSRLTAIAPAIQAMGATSLYLFGSTARGEAGLQSDLDLFIDYDPNGRFNALHLVGIKQFLEDELQTPIDITTRDGLHPMLRSKIERAAVRVF